MGARAALLLAAPVLLKAALLLAAPVLLKAALLLAAPVLLKAALLLAAPVLLKAVPVLLLAVVTRCAGQAVPCRQVRVQAGLQTRRCHARPAVPVRRTCSLQAPPENVAVMEWRMAVVTEKSWVRAAGTCHTSYNNIGWRPHSQLWKKHASCIKGGLKVYL